jgi:hypothetical protein
MRIFNLSAAGVFWLIYLGALAGAFGWGLLA